MEASNGVKRMPIIPAWSHMHPHVIARHCEAVVERIGVDRDVDRMARMVEWWGSKCT